MGWRARPSPPSKEEVEMKEVEFGLGGPFEFVRVGEEGDEKWKLMPRN